MDYQKCILILGEQFYYERNKCEETFCKLKNKYPSETFELVAIESWSGRTSLQKDYAKGKGLNYMLLGANEEVLKDYQTGRSAPWFFILDENRIIRKVFNGYSQERTGKEITQAIEALL